MYALWVTHTYINKHSPTSQRSQPTAVHTWATNRCWYAAVQVWVVSCTGFSTSHSTESAATYTHTVPSSDLTS